MGMFDYVEYEVDCVHCGAKVTGFQSKDGECSLVTLKVSEVRRFYSSCAVCGAWVDCEYVQPEAGKVVTEFGPRRIL